MISEGCPSGQREQTVNLPASAYSGSNPLPSTAVNDQWMSDRIRSEHDERATAGVAQLVERQPSKLNVAGSNPVSRSLLRSPKQQPHRKSTAEVAQW